MQPNKHSKPKVELPEGRPFECEHVTINMPIFEAGSAVLGQKEGKKENCLIVYPEGTSLPRHPKRIIMAYRLCLRLCSRYIGLLLGRHEANTGYGFYSHIRAVISARFFSRAKLQYADF